MDQVMQAKEAEAPLSVLLVSETPTSYLVSLRIDALMESEVWISHTQESASIMGLSGGGSEASPHLLRRVTLETAGAESTLRALIHRGNLFLILPKAATLEKTRLLE